MILPQGNSYDPLCPHSVLLEGGTFTVKVQKAVKGGKDLEIFKIKVSWRKISIECFTNKRFSVKNVEFLLQAIVV